MQHYETLGAIGQGQYGTAYKARHRLDGQLYCIKRIPMSAKDDQSGALKEVQLLAQLDHPNVIAYKESFIDNKDGALCIVTSFCEEGDLFGKIRKRAANNQLFSESEIMDMFVQIASALSHIHGKRILHRDLKTQNIFIARGNIIKLGDFGISKVLEKTDQFATTVTGTPYYMAPEICTNQPYTFKSDIWSLGCVLYEMCSLKHAFAADSLLSLVYQIVRGNFPPIGAQFSKGLHGLVNALLVREASQRPSLQEIFHMPYVHENLQRYQAEAKRALTKQSNTMQRRRQLLEKTQGDDTYGEGVDVEDANLTPKQRMEKNRDIERRKREMELRVASINTAKDSQVVAQRKAAMVHTSNTGLPGAASLPTTQYQGGYDGAPEVAAISAPGLGRMSSLKRGGDKNPWNAVDDVPAPNHNQTLGMGGGGMDDSMVNMGTMPANQGFGQTVMSDATRARMQGSRMDPGNQTAYEAMENRPIRAGASTRPAGAGALGAGDTVLLGTMNIGGGQTMSGSSVNIGTVNMGGGRTHASNPWALDGPAPRAPAAPAVPSNVVGGFKFGLTNPGAMPALPVFPAPAQRDNTPSPVRSASPPVSGKIKFGVSSDSQPRGSFEYVIKDANAERGGYSDYDEGGDDYEDDFEDYSPADDQDTINQKCKILSNIEDLERTGGQGLDDASLAQVRDKVGSVTKNSKATALREKCQQALGMHFAQVYAFLRKTREMDSSTVDESQVQKALHELVGGDKTLVQGCFLVDQLVFQEMMYR